MDFLNKYSPQIQSLLRIAAGLCFLEHGTSKLFSFPVGMGHPIALFTLIGAAGIIEFVGGILITLGLFSRIAAFIASGEMAIAYFTVHLPHSFFPTVNGGDAAILFCFIFLFIAAAGPGSIAINEM